MPGAWAGEYFETKFRGTASLTSIILMLTKCGFWSLIAFLRMSVWHFVLSAFVLRGLERISNGNSHARAHARTHTHTHTHTHTLHENLHAHAPINTAQFFQVSKLPHRARHGSVHAYKRVPHVPHSHTPRISSNHTQRAHSPPPAPLLSLSALQHAPPPATSSKTASASNSSRS